MYSFLCQLYLNKNKKKFNLFSVGCLYLFNVEDIYLCQILRIYIPQNIFIKSMVHLLFFMAFKTMTIMFTYSHLLCFSLLTSAFLILRNLCLHPDFKDTLFCIPKVSCFVLFFPHVLPLTFRFRFAIPPLLIFVCGFVFVLCD